MIDAIDEIKMFYKYIAPKSIARTLKIKINTYAGFFLPGSGNVLYMEKSRLTF